MPRFRLTTPFHRAWSTAAVAAVAFGVISALPAGGVVDASAHSATARAIPVRLLAHDVSHAIARQPRVHAHVTRRRMDVSAVFTSPLARLVPKPKRTLASAFHALAPAGAEKQWYDGGHRLPPSHFADQLAFLHRKIGTDAPVEADRVGPYPTADFTP